MKTFAPPTLSSVLRNALRFAVGAGAIYGALIVYKRLLFPLVAPILSVPEHWSAMTGRIGSLVVSMGAYFLFVRFYERRKPTELAIKPVAIAQGVMGGAALISLTILSLFLTGFYSVESVRGFGSGTGLIFATIVTAAVLEEILFRGLLFRILEEQVGTVSAVIFVSLLFGVLHLSNPGASPMTAVSVTLIGAFWCLVFAVSRNLWVTGLNHTAWNLAIFCSGVPLSGQEDWRQFSPLVSQMHGPIWLTGGAFGPEDSVINILLVALAIWFLWRRLARSDGQATTSSTS